MTQERNSQNIIEQHLVIKIIFQIHILHETIILHGKVKILAIKTVYYEGLILEYFPHQMYLVCVENMLWGIRASGDVGTAF